jgi:SAM-dependent methyltransferase
VYDLATPRIQQYLESETDHLLKFINKNDVVLELGCGYGRILPEIASYAKYVVGIDTSLRSLEDAKVITSGNIYLACMDAVSVGFKDNTFDVVICIQNGISAFKVNQKELIKEAARITRPGGYSLFSSYSEKIWNERLKWFELQSEAGLLGEIDYKRTVDGVIECKDGFRATTLGTEQFLKLTGDLAAEINIREVDESSIFCEIKKK